MLNWSFSGSSDGLNYEIISKHINDKSLTTVKHFNTVIFKVNTKNFYKIFQLNHKLKDQIPLQI